MVDRGRTGEGTREYTHDILSHNTLVYTISLYYYHTYNYRPGGIPFHIYIGT